VSSQAWVLAEAGGLLAAAARAESSIVAVVVGAHTGKFGVCGRGSHLAPSAIVWRGFGSGRVNRRHTGGEDLGSEQHR